MNLRISVDFEKAFCKKIVRFESTEASFSDEEKEPVKSLFSPSFQSDSSASPPVGFLTRKAIYK